MTVNVIVVRGGQSFVLHHHHIDRLDISETGIRIDGNGNEFKTIKEDGNSNNKNNELFPGVVIGNVRRKN